jgi:hypothetical protein
MGVVRVYETNKLGLLRRFVSTPSTSITVWVDRRTERSQIERELQELYSNDQFLKGHGFIARVQTEEYTGCVYVRTNSVKVNPDSMATCGLRRLFATMRDRLQEDQPYNQKIADFELSQSPVSANYWLHPAAHNYFDGESLKLRSARRELADTVADATLENIAVSIEDSLNFRAA